MATEWEFLKPWHAALCAGLAQSSEIDDEIEDELEDGSDLLVEFTCYPFNRDRVDRRIFTLRASHEPALLRQQGEAIELFTLLSFVSNRTFAERMIWSAGIRATVVNDQLYPVWRFQFFGTRPLKDPAVPHTPVTWATILGLREDPSPEFQAAAQKLEALKTEKSNEESFRLFVHWSCRFQCSRVMCQQDMVESAGGMNEVLGEFQKMLSLEAPTVVQLYFPQEKVLHVVPQSPKCDFVRAKISTLTASSDFLEMAAALARIPMSTFWLHLDCTCTDWVAGPLSRDSSQGVINALSTLVCGRSFCKLSRKNGGSSITSRAECQKVKVSCHSVPDDVFVAVLSALAEIFPKTQLTSVSLDSMNPERWAWLVYALYCSTPDIRNVDNSVSKLTIQEPTLTKADIAAIAAVLESGFPLITTKAAPRVYGFVDFDEGAQLGSSQLLADSTNALVGSCHFRSRATYDAANSGLVDVVVPGYGACTTRLGDLAHFTSDSRSRALYMDKYRTCDHLSLYFDLINDVGLVVDLLGLLFRGLRDIEINVNTDDLRQPIWDLGVLATVCPLLEDFKTRNCTVVAATQNEALRLWPIQKMLILETDTVSDLVSCLRNPALRMARELVELHTSPRVLQTFDEEEMNGLDALNGEFLAVTKKKLSKLEKAALISVVRRGCTLGHATMESKALNHMDANILSLIFAFASTPAQRSVCTYKSLG